MQSDPLRSALHRAAPMQRPKLAALFIWTMCFRMSNGLVSCLGDFEGASGAYPRVPFLVNADAGGAPLDEVEQVIVGQDLACAIRGGGSLWCWTVSYVRTESGGFLEKVVDLAAGSSVTCALTTEGEVWCWGAAIEPHEPHPVAVCPEE